MVVQLGGPSSAQDVIGGRYRLLQVIGAGGMGKVWQAEDQLLGRTVAVKELTTPSDVSTSEMLDLQLATMREARAAARLDHPGVVQVFDVVWRPGRSWIVMEYVPSRSLHDAVQQDGPLSHREAARIGLGILSALRAAHGAGVLHRDVKPHNVLLADDGRVVLTDFGLATLEGSEPGPGETEPLLGSPFYVAPERLKGVRSSERSDLWSLGATLYTAVEGRPPFKRDSTTKSLAALLVEPPDTPAHPGPLSLVLNGLLVKDPARRMSAEQVEPLLRRVADRAIGVFAIPRQLPRRRSLLPSRPAATAAGSDPVLARTAGIAIAVAAVLLVGTAGTAIALSRDSDAAPPTVVIPSGGSAPAALDCRAFGGGSPMTAGAAQPDYLLPAGWLWHVDAAGNRVAVPQGWTQVVTGDLSCFSDPDSDRSLMLDSGVQPTGSARAHWEVAEKTALAAGLLPGYQRVALDVRPDGAAWEYTWKPAGLSRQHELRALVTTRSGRTYTVDWRTADLDWSLNRPYLQLILASLA